MAIHYVESNCSAPSISRHGTPEHAAPKQDAPEHAASESSITKSSSSKPSTPEQHDAKSADIVTGKSGEPHEPVEPVEPVKAAKAEEEEKPVYLPRADRMNQTPSKGNAQGLFLPDCCVFVGNLSIKVSLEKLEEDLTDMISTFGRCHVKIKLSQGLKKLPVAFVQFEDIKAANSALKQNGNLMLHNRVLRLESSRARRTAHFGYLTDEPIEKSVIVDALKGLGSLEGIAVENYVNPQGEDSTFGVVTFAYPDDYADALQHFQNHPDYYMTRPAMDPNDNQLSQDYPAPGHRPSNQPLPNRGNQQRYNNNGRRSFHRPWYSGGNNNRGGFRNAPGAGPRHQNTPFANHGHSQSFNGQGHSPHGSFSQNYPGGNGFPQNNFNQGYPNPNYQNFPGNNFPPNYQGNNFPPNYPNQNFIPAGAFPNPPVMFSQIHMHDGPPPYPADYTAMPTPGFPVFLGNQSYQPSNPLPPIVTQPQPQPVAGPVPGRRRLPPRPDCPLIVSSQPQFDTEHHRQLYYEPYPADDTFTNMQSSWVGPPGACFVQPDYNQPYPPNAYPHSRQSSVGSQQNNSSPPRVNESKSALTQTKVQTPETERGRQLARPRHPNTDGGSDMAPVSAPAKTQSEPVSIQALDDSHEMTSMVNVSKSTETHIGSRAPVKETIESQSKSAEPENELNSPQSESTFVPSRDKQKERLMDEVKLPLRIDTKNEESTGSSSEAGPKTPDTDESREDAQLQTPVQSDSVKSADTKTPDTTETLKPVDKSAPSKNKSPELATATPTKSNNRRLEPAVPENRHLLARHAFQHRRPLKKKYQPKTDTGKTIEQYTREINAQRASADPDSRVPDHILQEVIQELESERRDALRKSRGLGPSDSSSVDSGTSSKK
ncbi:Nucleotide-binding alpha-beta plait [Penicillium coprophilum]|uniref:Nucleotide-binding alpha-beta plait n=1 Tax=Penicillium coprophilum TaxID=36646 RepID=UPI00238CA6BA|nr:Nucleotide-binding alpha-beta plait [Penicillium coprophilum]KAJ5154200.1 Nucleotide-binding alpha-beta plait [Penicillium coprophilum]